MNPKEQFEQWWKYKCGHLPEFKEKTDVLVVDAIRAAWLEAFRLGHHQGMTRAAEISKMYGHGSCHDAISGAILTERDKSSKL